MATTVLPRNSPPSASVRAHQRQHARGFQIQSFCGGDVVLHGHEFAVAVDADRLPATVADGVVPLVGTDRTGDGEGFGLSCEHRPGDLGSDSGYR